MNNIRNLSEVAKTLMESDARFDQDICKMTILFPLLETLGYDATKAGDIILNPAYVNDGDYKMDYGLRGETDESVKTMIKMIEFDAEPGLEFANIRKCIMPGDQVEYIIITDCFNYYVYANADGGITFMDIVSFNICDVNNAQIRSFGILRNPNVSARQDYALNDEEVPALTPNKKYEKSESSKSETTKTVVSGTIMPIVILSICVVIILSAALFGFFERGNVDNWYKVSFTHDSVSLTYHTLKGNVTVSTYPNKLDCVNVKITNTNLPANANVTLTLKSSNGQTLTMDVLTGIDGCIDKDVPIGSQWKNSTVSVTASLVFNTYQTSAVTEKYGQYGQFLVSLTGDKNIIGTNETYYDYDAIYALIQKEAADKAAAELKAIQEYFSNYTIVKYSNGDMCFYPKGYDTNDWDSANDNITSTNKSYAKIYYSATTQTGTFYYVTGTFMKSASWPAGEFILSDTVNSYNLSIKNGRFKYHMNKYSSVTGWCQFDPNGINSLIPILTQIYSSNASTIEFKDIHKVSISQADKDAVLGIIDLYTKYFANGKITLNPDWFK
jgi:hypothetical protein